MVSKLDSSIIVLFLVCISCTSVKQKNQAYNITSTFITEKPVTANSHAATLVEYKPNQIMAAWFGGKYEGAKDVGIYSSVYKEKVWSSPQCLITPAVIKGDTLPCWNPVLFKAKSKILYLFYKVGKNPREWFGAMISSKDDGMTWSKPEYLPEGILGPIKNKPIEVTQGVILCGSSTESVEKNQWRSHVETYTESTGTWKKISIENKQNFEIIQPAFLVHSDSEIQLLFRSKHNKLITSWSHDNGQNWHQTDSLNVKNSNSGIDALTVNKNFFLLVNNPLEQGKDWFNGRNILDVEHSKDGIHWEKLFDLENQPEGEFSYPAIIQTSDKMIHVLYTYNRKYIKHVAFNLEA
ncbi:glycosyl hydrolase [Flavobacterium sp. GA093]|uniref:Glycosyl hydrolase n=1 Tax=Flavobacterium hydrocarbonoxydans TaxID=2683249 RepID=A0A6I4NKE0_9FLAO|nr:sialidase family protein [Flavobacterium hydrocarbonoxydans]MWB93292.1 glycosyl hydrolase [Flavobacterium hydrocarbonoxydans]